MDLDPLIVLSEEQNQEGLGDNGLERLRKIEIKYNIPGYETHE